jgi:hypothetical protein
VLQLLRGSRQSGGLVGSQDRPAQQLRGVPGLREVVGDLRSGRRSPRPCRFRCRLESGRLRGVQPRALAGQQVAVHRLPQQIVHERVTRPVRPEHALGHRDPHRLVKVGVAQAGDPAQQPVG